MNQQTCDDDLDTLGDLFVAENDRPAHLSAVQPESLPAFARVLLVTDGTVTHMLRAHFREPVKVHVEAHNFAVLEEDLPWLEASAGREILIRDVTLTGKTSGHLFASARSHIALERLTPEMREDIITMRRSIGNVLLANFSENRRELLWHGLTSFETDAADTPGMALERSYRVIAGGKPLMIITETFAPLILAPDAAALT